MIYSNAARVYFFTASAVLAAVHTILPMLPPELGIVMSPDVNVVELLVKVNVPETSAETPDSVKAPVTGSVVAPVTVVPVISALNVTAAS